MVITAGNAVVRLFLYILYPVSCASWARMMDRSLFFSKKLHAALYLCTGARPPSLIAAPVNTLRPTPAPLPGGPATHV